MPKTATAPATVPTRTVPLSTEPSPGFSRSLPRGLTEPQYRSQIAARERTISKMRRNVVSGLLDMQVPGVEARINKILGPGERHYVRIDMRDFGRINKEHGHAAGDAVIGKLGAALRKSTRAGEVAAHEGGDEFTMVIKGSRQDAEKAAERARQIIAAEVQRPEGAPVDLRHGIGSSKAEANIDLQRVTTAEKRQAHSPSPAVTPTPAETMPHAGIDVSPEAINRLASEKAREVRWYRVNLSSGKAQPMIPDVANVDIQPRGNEAIVRVEGGKIVDVNTRHALSPAIWRRIRGAF